MPLETIFCTPPQFAEETGIDVRIIRDMCEKKIIPCEIYNGRYRILHSKALKILTKRAEEFEGHYRPERSAVLEAIRANRSSARQRTAKQQLVFDQLRGLA
jgi:hypothetical protein